MLNVVLTVAGQNTLLAERFGNTSTGASQWTSYLWLGGQPVGLVKGNTLYWVTADHLGRPEVVTNASQQVVWRAANQAFDRSVLLDQIGGYRLGFPGQSLDAESGLWHNGFRDYDASLGRYVQSDPIGLAGGVSTFAYVGGNPVMQIDPLGLCSCGLPQSDVFLSNYPNYSDYDGAGIWSGARLIPDMAQGPRAGFRTLALRE